MCTKRFVIGILALIGLAIATIYCLYLGHAIEAVVLGLFVAITAEHFMDKKDNDE